MRQILTSDALASGLTHVLKYRGLSSPKWAVIIPIVANSEAHEILLEVRSAEISQAGDPCFPGGKVEPDESPEAAALRELQEELGIHAEPTSILGQLPTVNTFLGSKTNIYVCVISEADASGLCANTAEVARVLSVPISYFLENPHESSYTIDGSTVWGMTAGAIHHLCDVWTQAFGPEVRG